MPTNDIIECRTCPVGSVSPSRCPFTPLRYAEGAILCSQGEAPEAVFFLRDGLVEVSGMGDDGEERSFDVRTPGGLLCADAIRGQPSPVQVKTLMETHACVATPAALEQWLGPPTPARAMLDLVVQELSRRTGEVSRRSGDASMRLARFLLDGGENLPSNRKGTLARLLGMRPETFSRALRRLSGAGLVNPHTLRVTDHSGLAAVATGDRVLGKSAKEVRPDDDPAQAVRG